MACNGAAGGSFEDLLKAGVQLVYFAANLLDDNGIALCVSDENSFFVYIASSALLVGHIVDEALGFAEFFQNAVLTRTGK